MMQKPGRSVPRLALAVAVIVCLLGAHARACDTSAIPPQEMNAKLASCVAKLEADVEQLTKQVAALQGILAQAHAADDIVIVRTIRLDGLPNINRPPLASGSVQCPRGSWISGIEAVAVGTGPGQPIQQQPARELRYSCRALK